MSDNTNNDLIETTIITGAHIFISEKLIVGYCHYYKHKGTVTKKILKNHKCVIKDCHYFEKYADNSYWKNVEQKKAIQLKKRETALRIKNEEEARNKEWIEKAEHIADIQELELKIIRIKKVPKKKKYVLFYISKNPKNDWYMFLELAKEFGKEIGGTVELRHIKDIDGYYATY